MTRDRFTFLHAADLHIDSPLRGLNRYEEAPVEAIRSATRRAFENLVAAALEQEVAFVILAGDVFDGNWRDWGTGLWFAARLRQLTEAGIRVYMVAGNHDAAGKITMSIDYPEGVHSFGSAQAGTIVDAPTGAVLHGQSFATAATTEDLAAGYPQATASALNIGVLHTALNGRPGHDAYAPCTVETLRSRGYDYWALGHVHHREVVAEDPWIVFPGNLQARHIREPGPKGATLVEVEDGRVVAVSHQVFDVVRFACLSIDVAACESRAACEDAVAEALVEARDQAADRLLATRLVVHGHSAAHASLCREAESFVNACRNRANALGGIWVEKVELDTREPLGAGGHDIVEALELDSAELRAVVCESLTADLAPLLSKLGPHFDPVRNELDLRDEATLLSLMDRARDELVLRLVEADGLARSQRGDSAGDAGVQA